MNRIEQAEAEAFIRWRDMRAAAWPFLRGMFHVPNEGKRSVITGAALKRAGMRKGVVDYFLPHVAKRPHSPPAVDFWPGLFLELKPGDGSGRLEPEQIEFLDDVAAQGYAVAVAFGWVHASEIVSNYVRGVHRNEEDFGAKKNGHFDSDPLGSGLGRFP